MQAFRALLLIPLLPVIIVLFLCDSMSIYNTSNKTDRLIDAVLGNP